MPIAPQNIDATAPKSGTYQWSEHRIDGIPLVIPVEAGVSSCGNRRIVSLQEDANGNRYAVLHPFAVALDSVSSPMTIIGYGVLEESLQAGGLASIAPTPNTFVDGDIVTVRRGPTETFMIDFDPSNEPAIGIASARVDAQGRLTSAAASGTILQLQGSVFESTPGAQLTGQLAANTKFYQMRDAVTP